MSATRPFCSIIIFVCILNICCFSTALAYEHTIYVWNPVGSDCNWNNPDNWNYGVPMPEFQAIIEPKLPSPCIYGDAACAFLTIAPWSWTGAPDISVDMYSGTFNCNYGISIGAWGTYSNQTDNTTIPCFNVYGGTVNQSASPGDGILIGGGDTGYRDLMGKMNVYGGYVTARRIELRFGEINLFGGTLDCNTDANFILRQDRPQNKINVNGGTLKVKGNHLTEFNNYVNNGRIVCLRGGQLNSPVYDGTYTSITGSVDFNLAWNPSPETNAVNVHYRVGDVNIPITLSWNSGEPNVVAHDVYFGTSSSALVHQGTSYDVGPGPHTWDMAFDYKIYANYYWRIDEIINSDSGWIVKTGQLWKFKTHDGKAYNPKPINGASALSQPLQLSWTKGDFAANTNGHKVYFSTDASVLHPLFPRPSDYRFRGQQTGTTYSLANLAPDFVLVPGRNYYWAVDEVNGTTTWKGPTWSFTASDYVVVDNFEDYNSAAEVNANWLSGYTTCQSEGPDITANAVRNFIHDADGKYMQVGYRNYVTNYFSETKRSYNPAVSFTGSGVLNPGPFSLYIQYRGFAQNPADPTYDRMYVALEDSAGNIGVFNNPNPNAQKIVSWTSWTVPLSSIASEGIPTDVNLSAITNFYIGFGQRCNFYMDGGGDGNVMFDNILLVPSMCDWPGIMQADFDKNCYVNMYDLSLLTQFWLESCPVSNPCIGIIEPGCPPGAQCLVYRLYYPVTDFTGDDTIDFEDFRILAQEWKTVLLGP